MMIAHITSMIPITPKISICSFITNVPRIAAITGSIEAVIAAFPVSVRESPKVYAMYGIVHVAIPINIPIHIMEGEEIAHLLSSGISAINREPIDAKIKV